MLGRLRTLSLTDEQLAALVGRRFPGGRHCIAHWENWLLTDCTGYDQLPSPLVHPVALFHTSILGSNMSIQDLFTVLGAEGPAAVGLLSYDWEFFRPLREDLNYDCECTIVGADRQLSDNGRVSDEITFTIAVNDDDGLSARVTNRWRIYRGGR
jgi:hypothetical protein